MNNAKITLDYSALAEPPEVDRTPVLREREGELIKIISAIRGIEGTDEWKTLKELIFGKVIEILERNLKEEAVKNSPDTLSLARISGQLLWAKKYADLSKLAEVYRQELTNIRKTLHGKEKES